MSSNAETVRNKKNPVVAIAGATGAVGVELMQCLEQRKFPLSELRLLASARSAGKTMKFRGGDLAVQELTDQSLEGVDIALFSAGGAQSKRFAPAAVRAGAIVVDNSSAFRMDTEVPLVVPEINASALACTTASSRTRTAWPSSPSTPLWPIHQKRRIKRIVMSTYQAASGAGAAAMEELSESTRAYLEGRAFQPKVLPHPYAFNVFSHNTKVDPETGLQRGRDQGDAGVPQDFRRSRPACDRYLCARAGIARALHRVEHRTRVTLVARRSAVNTGRRAGRACGR